MDARTKQTHERRAAGVCETCSGELWRKRKCFRCDMVMAFAKRGLAKYRRRSLPAWNRFVNGMAARYQRILMDEGFAVDAIKEPQEVIRLSGMSWAKRGTTRKKVLEIIAWYDDHAIRKRFS